MSADLETSPSLPARSRWVEAGFVIAFWGMIVMLNVGRRAIDPRGPNTVSTPVILFSGLEYVLWGLFTPVIFWLARRFSLERTDWLRPVLVHVAVALGVALMFDMYGHASYEWFFGDQRADPFNVWENLIAFRFLDELIVYLVVLAAGFARDYFLRYRERQERAIQLEAEKARLESQLTEARLQTLRMQLNPHFLFNTLHAISSLVGRNPADVRRMIARLSELLRYTLEHSGAQEIPLQQELDLLDRYLQIQQIRFQDSLEIVTDVEPDAAEALVPNLLLQPLVENAIKHGVSQIEGRGRITVEAWREGDDLRLRVSDNGPGIAGDGAPDPERGVGLRNTRQRLEGLYGDAYHLDFSAAGPTGLAVEVALPFHTSADLLTQTVGA